MKLFSDKTDNNKEKVSQKKAGPTQRPAAPKARTEKSAKQLKQTKELKGGKRAVIIIVSVLLVLCAVAFLLGAYANGIETVYPNVSMEGTDIGRMTVEEAANALSQGVLGTAEDRELLVSLPAGCELIISAKEAGCFMSAPDAAVFAYETCRDGGFFGSTITYIRCITGGLELTSADGAKLDEEYIRTKTAEGVRQANLALMENDLEIGEESIAVVKGAGSVSINEEELFEIIITALQKGDFLPVRYTSSTETQADGEKAEIDLQKLYDTIFEEPKNAEYDAETKQASEHVVGKSFDMAEAERLWNKAANGDRVIIPLILTEPEITTEKLNSMLFSDLLSQKSTGLGGSSAARINNITKAAAALNGIVLNPGEELSYNKALGQRTTSAGYQGAGAYSGGKVVTEVGGGICQVSSTLYYCTLIANLEIIDRTCHYFGVSYLPAGLDATVSWPSPDFKFKNSSEYPIKIEAGIDKQAYTVYVKIYGSNPDGIRVEMTTETWGTATGYGAVSYRCVYDRDGNLISKKEEAKSQYHYHTEEEDDKPSPSPSDEASPSPSKDPESPAPSPSASVSPSVPVDPSPIVPTPTAPVEPEAPTAQLPAVTPTPEGV